MLPDVGCMHSVSTTSTSAPRLHSCCRGAYVRAATWKLSRRLAFSTPQTSHVRLGKSICYHAPNRNRQSVVPSCALTSEAIEALLAPHPGLLVGAAVNSLVYLLGIQILLKGLTTAGYIHSWFLGATIFSAFGLGGYAIVCSYFVFGTLVTKIKLEQKQKEGIAEARSGRRGPGSVWGSGSAGTACALFSLLLGNYHPLQVGFVASFVSKLADTVSSEIGKAYGRTTVLVTTLQVVPRGTEGAISLEGTAAGLAAALLFSLLAVALQQVTLQEAAVCATAATAANLFESWLGATVQGRVPWLTNDIVNTMQISLAAALAAGAASWLGM